MAVQRNPYWEWEDNRDRADYRSRETQASSFTRQMLRQPEYLRFRNRVNPGPVRNLRARDADLKDQIPHNPNNEDVWGWQFWADLKRFLEQSEFSSNLLEEGAPIFSENGPQDPLFPIYTDPQSSSVYNKPGVGIRFRGQVPTVADLPTDAVGGDAYIVQSDDSFRVWDPISHVWVNGGSILRGDPGPVGPPGVPFVFIQPTPSATWVINHDLGHIPSVELFDPDDSEIDAEIGHPTENQTVVHFSIPIAGSARLI